MQTGILLGNDKLKEFCKELNIDCNTSNFDDDCFYELDLEIAKKYL